MKHMKTIAEIGRNTKFEVIGPNFNFCVVSILLLTILKICNVTDINWYIVFAPLWFSIAIVCFLWMITICVYSFILFLFNIIETCSKKKHF